LSEYLAKESLITVACRQIEPNIEDKEENVKKTIKFAKEAASKGSDVILLPELTNSGYVFNTREEAFSLAEEVPEGDTTRLWEDFAVKEGVYLAAGIPELKDYKLYNSSVLLGPEGYIGKYRKLHLWNREKLFFEPGNLGLQVFKTSIGRLAMYICYGI
jgi:predicted amidohydrolase